MIIRPYDRKPPPLTPIDVNDPINRGVVGSWLLGDRGLRAYDTSQSKVHGVLTNFSGSGSPYVGGSLRFTASSSHYIAITSPGANILNTVAKSMCAWITPFSFPNAYNGVVGDATGFVMLYVKSDGRPAIYLNDVGRSIDNASSPVLSANVRSFICVTYDSVGGLDLYINCKLDQHVTPNGNLSTASRNWLIGAEPAFSRYFNGIIDNVKTFNRKINLGEIFRLYNQQYVGFSQPRRVAAVKTAAAGSDINGSAVITLAGITAAATGALAIAGSATMTLANITLTAAGQLALTGSANITLAPVTVAAAGQLAISGAATMTIADVTVVATGAGPTTGTGTANLTLDGITVAATGQVAITGSASITLAPITTTAAGQLAITGTLNRTLANITVTAVGTSAAITFDAVSNSGYKAGFSTYSWAHTCTGTDRYLHVDIAILSAGVSVLSVTYDGVPLSLFYGQDGLSGSTIHNEEWHLVAPSLGTHNIVVTLSGVLNSMAIAESLDGVNQVTPRAGLNPNVGNEQGDDGVSPNLVATTNGTDWIGTFIFAEDTAVTYGGDLPQLIVRGSVSGGGASLSLASGGPFTVPDTQFFTWTDLQTATHDYWNTINAAILKSPDAGAGGAGITYDPYQPVLVAGRMMNR